ncbi:MAG: hypothetical protein AB9844_08005 [Clostridiaceae bacterium]
MVKPSIFSSDYEKRMRRRRISFALFFVIIAFIIAGIYLIGKGHISDFLTKKANQEVVVDKNKDKKEQEQKTVEGSYNLTLIGGSSIKTLYKTEGSAKKFTGISPEGNNISCSINSPGNKIVVYDGSTQSMTLVDTDGNIQDITKTVYQSTSGSQIVKDNVLSTHSGYIWCASPVFISESKVAYISQLPWLNKTSKFVWIVDVVAKEHSRVRALEGESVVFGKPDSRGLEVNIDGRIIYLAADGSIIE